MTALVPEPERWTGLLLPRFRYGVIFPTAGGVRRGTGYQFYRLVPLDVMEVSVGLGIQEYTREGVEDAMANFWNCIDLLAAERVDSILLAGVPVSSQLGRGRVLDLIEQVRQRTGIQMHTSLEDIISSLQHLAANRVAVASRWASQLNDALIAYLATAGIEVVHMTSRNQWAERAFGMSLEEGLRMALEVAREAAREGSRADAIFAPGGAAMSLHVIPAIEEEFGKPVVTNQNAEVWQTLVRPGIIAPVRGWGMLLANGQQ